MQTIYYNDSGKCTGLVDYGKILSGQSRNIAFQALELTLVGLKDSWKCLTSSSLKDRFDADTQITLLKSCLFIPADYIFCI